MFELTYTGWLDNWGTQASTLLLIQESQLLRPACSTFYSGLAVKCTLWHCSRGHHKILFVDLCHQQHVRRVPKGGGGRSLGFITPDPGSLTDLPPWANSVYAVCTGKYACTLELNLPIVSLSKVKDDVTQRAPAVSGGKELLVIRYTAYNNARHIIL